MQSQEGRRWGTLEKLLEERLPGDGAGDRGGCGELCPPCTSFFIVCKFRLISTFKKKKKKRFSGGFQTPIHLEKTRGSGAFLMSGHKKPTGSLAPETLFSFRDSRYKPWRIQTIGNYWFLLQYWFGDEEDSKGWEENVVKCKWKVSTIGPAWPDALHQIRSFVYVASFSFWRNKKCQQLENVCNVNTAVLAQLQGKHTQT